MPFPPPRCRRNDHSNGIVADDEADIGDRAAIVLRHQFDGALAHEDAGRYFHDTERLLCKRETDRGQHEPARRDEPQRE